MEEFEIPTKLINITKATFKKVKCRVKLGNDLPEVFYTDRGLWLGDTLSCLIFNLTLKKAIKTSGLVNRGIIYYKTIQILTFADGIA
ncbi:hypothetical protein X975_02241, partial [Stegodyphus mimosarum]